MRKLLTLIFLSSIALTAHTGCGVDDDHDHDQHTATEGPDDDGCEHMKETEQALTAGADKAEAAAVRTHKKYAVTLPAAGSGYLKLTAREGGDYTIYLSKPVTSVSVINTVGDAEVTAETSNADVSACTEAAKKYVFELEKNGVYLIKIESTESPFNLAVIDGGHDHDHDHDHNHSH